MTVPEQGAVTRESPVCRAIPVVWDKFVVDFANGIDVAADHVNTQRERSGLFDRLLDGVTGQGAHRQTEIDARLLDSVEGSYRWLDEVTKKLGDRTLAIGRVNKAVCRLSDDVSTLASFSADTRQVVEDIRAFTVKRLDAIHEWAWRKDAYDDAVRQQHLVFAKWEAGEYNGISLAGRCYVALEELRWGEFGAYVAAPDHSCDRRRRQELLELARVRARGQMDRDAVVESAGQRMPTSTWLAEPARLLPDAQQALAFLADVHTEAPFVRTVSAYGREHGTYDEVPLISSAERVADALTEEVFRVQE